MFTKENGIMLIVVVVAVLIAMFIGAMLDVSGQGEKVAAKIKGEA